MSHNRMHALGGSGLLGCCRRLLHADCYNKFKKTVARTQMERDAIYKWVLLMSSAPCLENRMYYAPACPLCTSPCVEALFLAPQPVRFSPCA